MPPATPRTNEANRTLDKVLDAIRENDSRELTQIFERNENIDLNLEKDGTYPLHMCLGLVDCVKVLLEHGANPDLTDEAGKRPIHFAVERDFVETLMLLVIYGADFNAKINGKTPLQIATEEHSQACHDLLHFLGAKMPDDQLNIFDEDTKCKYEVIQKGFSDRMIISGGTRIPKNCGHPIQIESQDRRPVGIGIQGYDDSFIVFVRRMHVEFQTSSIRIPVINIPEGMELISDVYQYKVDRNITCDLHIPVSGTDKLDKYKELLVIQMKNFGLSSKDVSTNVNIKDNKAVVKGIHLYAYGSSPTVAFGIFSSIKTDRKVVDLNQDLTLQSSVIDKFKVFVPAGSASANTEIQLQVIIGNSKCSNIASAPKGKGKHGIRAEYFHFMSTIPLKELTEYTKINRIITNEDIVMEAERGQSPDSGIGSHSDFLSVSSVSAQTHDDHSGDTSNESVVNPNRPLSAASINYSANDDVYISLPKPNEDVGSQIAVFKCGQDADGTEAGSWRIEESVTIEGKTVEYKHGGYGKYIVLSVKKLGYLLKEFVSELYSRSKGDKQNCKLFAMVNHRDNTTEYLVQVVLCRTEDYNDRVRDCLKRNFREQECGPTDDIEIDSKCTYMLKLILRNANVLHGPDALPIQYQGQHPKSQTFTVESVANEPASGMVLSFKREVPKKPQYYGKKCRTTLAIRFTACKIHSIPNEKFLSDRFIEDVAITEIGIKWFSLGILLGFTCAELCALQDMEPQRRSGMILYKWRDDAASTMEEKLDNFVLATRQAELPNLRQKIFKDVFKFRQVDNGLDRWVRKYEEQGRDDQEVKLRLGQLTTKPVSPLSDKFLLFVAKLSLTNDTLFTELDLMYEELEHGISNQEHRRCKLLMLARDRCSDTTAFLGKLKNALLVKSCVLTLQEISACVKQWLNSFEANNSDVDARTKAVLQTIFK